MVHLRNLCDPALVDEAIGAGLVSVQTDERLRILNHTAKATYSRHWNEATVACRGLILDDADRVVARPFPKFFGPSEPDAPALPTHQEMEVTAKLDAPDACRLEGLLGGQRSPPPHSDSPRTTTCTQARSSLSARGEQMRASPSGPTRSRADPANVRQSATPATGRTTSTPPSSRSLRRTVDLSILSATPCIGVDTTQR